MEGPHRDRRPPCALRAQEHRGRGEGGRAGGAQAPLPGLQISKTAKEGALIMANKESVTRFTYSKSSINKLALPTLNYL